MRKGASGAAVRLELRPVVPCVKELLSLIYKLFQFTVCAILVARPCLDFLVD
jgi:hypothetical protein